MLPEVPQVARVLAVRAQRPVADVVLAQDELDAVVAAQFAEAVPHGVGAGKCRERPLEQQEVLKRVGRPGRRDVDTQVVGDLELPWVAHLE